MWRTWVVATALVGLAGCSCGSDSDDDDDDDDVDAAVPVCGNGTQEQGEECDLGADNADTGACTSSCLDAACGDGLVQAGVEECDLGADNADTGACTSGCLAAACGDGLVQTGIEECDLGAGNADTAACTSACRDAFCGDGFVQEGVEGCEETDAVQGNGCNAGCVASGTLLWTRTAAPEEIDWWVGVAASDSGVAVAGMLGDDFVVRKYTHDGDIAWTRTYTPDVPAGGAAAVAVDANETVWIVGTVGSPQGDTNYLTMRFTAEGEQGNTYPHGVDIDSDDSATGVAAAPGGGIYVTGKTTLLGVDDSFVAFHRNDANLQWRELYDANEMEGGSAVAATADGPVACGWTLAGFDEQAWIRKYDALGAYQWTAGFDGSAAGDDLCAAVSVGPAGEIVAAGFVTVAGVLDMVLQTFDPAGGTLWSWGRDDEGTGDASQAFAVAADPGGDVLVAGAVTTGLTPDAWLGRLPVPPTAPYWSERYDSPNHGGDGNFAMALAPTGEVYVVGRTAGAEPSSWLRKYAP